MRRFVFFPAIAISVLLAVAILGAAWLLYTESGLKQISRLSMQLEPGLILETPTGSILGGARFALVAWRQPGVIVEVSNAKAELAPICLLSMNLCAKKLNADKISVDIQSLDTGEELPTPLQLPAITLPFEIFIVKTKVNTLHIIRNQSEVFSAEKILLEGFLWRKYTLSFSPLTATIQGEKIKLKGKISLNSDYPIKAVASVNPQQLPDYSAYLLTTTPAKVDTPLGEIEALISGSLRDLHAQFTLQGLIDLSGKVHIQPLAESAPFTATVTLEQPVTLATVPANNNEYAVVDKATVELNGDLNGLNLSLAAEADIPFAIGKSSILLAASTDFASLAIQQAEFISDRGNINANGQVYFDNENVSNFTLSVSDFDPAIINSHYHGRLNADVNLDISQLLSDPILTAVISNVDGELMDASVITSGSLSWSRDQQLQFNHWSISNDGNSINIDGSFPNGKADWAINIANAEYYFPQARGQLTASGSLSGTLAQPSLIASLQATNIGYNDFQAKTLSSSVAIKQLALTSSTLKLQGSAVTLPGLQQVIDLELEFSVKQRHTAKAIEVGSHWSLTELADTTINLNILQKNSWQSSLQCSSTFNLSDYSVSGQCNQARLTIDQQILNSPKLTRSVTTNTLDKPELNWSDWANDKAIVFNWQSTTKQLQLDSFCLQNGSSTICLTEHLSWQQATPAALHLTGSHLQLEWLTLFTPDTFKIKGEWTFDAVLDEKTVTQAANEITQSWQLQGNINADNSLLIVNLNEPTELELPIENIHLDFSADNSGAMSKFLLSSSQIGDIAGYINFQQKILQGKLLLNHFDLQPLQTLLPNVKKLNGIASSDLSFKLIDNSIALFGDFSISEFSSNSTILPVEINDGEIKLSFDNTNATLKGQLSIGKGNADFSGDAQWTSTDWLANLAIQSTAIRIEPLPHSYLNLDSNISITASPQLIKIGGELTIPKARIEIEKLPENAITVSDDAIMEDQSLNSGGMQISAVIKTVLGDDVKFTGFGLKTNLAGNLTIKQQPGQLMSGNGVINLKDGRYRAYGQDLSIEEGRMIFAGPLTDPSLLVSAIRTRTEDNVRVGVLASGSAKEPAITLFSSPAMSEQNMLYYLLTGKGPNTASGDQAQLAQQTAIALSLAQTNRRAGDIASSLGIQDFQMNTDVGKHGEEAQFSGYITPELYLLYGVSLFDQLSSVTARYTISPNIYVEIYDSTASAIDIFWSITKD